MSVHVLIIPESLNIDEKVADSFGNLTIMRIFAHVKSFHNAMGTYINIGNAGFQSARNGEYVDKSMAARMLYAYYDRDTKQHSCHIEKV